MSGIETQEGASLSYRNWRKKLDVVNDQGRTDEYSPVTLNLFANDKNASGATIWHIDGHSVRTGNSVDLSSGARVTVGENGVVTYDPSESGRLNMLNGGESDVDSFTYEAASRYGKDTATIRIAVDGVTDEPQANSASVAADDVARIPIDLWPEEGSLIVLSSSPEDAFTTMALGEEGDPDPLPDKIEIAPLANDHDPDGDALTIGKIDGAVVSPGETVKITTGAQVTVSGDGTKRLYEGMLSLNISIVATSTDDGEDLDLVLSQMPPIPLSPLPLRTRPLSAMLIRMRRKSRYSRT